MDTQQPRLRIPEVQFRVLIIGRANAGNVAVLQRVCKTTESPIIYQAYKKVTLDPSIRNASLAFPNTVAPMHKQQPGRRIRKIQFR
ncbi:hypothetical protein EDB86DRAFT_2983901 [Lactarius hatsudake]|nr:hypothetical protein EDB86DRAFT_2983901 [Lactarius hatsudake]